MLIKIDTCLKLSELLRITGYLITIIKILVPIILIFIGIKNLAKTIIDGKSETIKKSFVQFVKNLIAGLIVFLIPTFIPYLFSSLIDNYDKTSAKMCNTCLFEPNSSACSNQIKEYTELQKRLEDIDVMGVDYANTTFQDVGEEYAKAITEEAKRNGKKIATNKNNEEVYGTTENYNTGKRETASGKREKVLATAEKMSKQVEQDVKNGKKWYYSNKGCKGSFEKAEADDVYKTNCALGVVWILKTAGVLEPNQGFYTISENGRHAIGGKMSESDIREKFDIVEVNGKATAKDLIKNGSLEAGDVVLWYDHGHTNMYAGNNLWYDMGRNFTGGYGTMDEYYFKTFGPVRIKYYEEARVWRILKVK
jgi:hypothetical protein